MAKTQNIEIACAGERVSFQASASGEANIDEAIVADQADVQYNIAIDFSAIQSLCIICDTGVTIKTNSSSVPDDTIVITADRPYIWYANHPDAVLLTADVTTIFVSEDDSDTGVLKILCTQDASP